MAVATPVVSESSLFRRRVRRGRGVQATLRVRCVASAVAGAATWLTLGCGEPATPQTDARPTVIQEGSPARVQGIVGEPLTEPVRVRVVTQSGAPVVGVQVVWTPESGAVAPADAVTGPDGTARGTWTLGPIAGEQRLTVSAAGVSTPARFTAAAAPGAVVTLVVGQDLVEVREADHLGVEATGTDRFGNVTPTAARTWSSSDPGVAAVDDSGRVTGVAQGSAVVTVATGTVRASVGVRVRGVAWRSIAGSVAQTCALSRAGVAYCWGEAFTTLPPFGAIVRQTRPVRVDGPLRFSALTGSWSLFCALSVDGAPYCWGALLTPSPVSTALRFTTIAVGAYHRCALDAAGQAHCWGANTHGQLGIGDLPLPGGGPTPTPHAVTPTSSPLRALSLAWESSCALDAAGGVVCWGADGSPAGSVRTPTRVPLGFAATAVANGSTHQCVLDGAGAVHCWGDDRHGQLGRGAASASRRETAALVPGAPPFVELAATGVSVCGRTAAGAVWCWGRDNVDRGTIRGATPVPVPSPVGALWAGESGNHTCVVSVGGDAFCWGMNDFGQLGDGTTTPRAQPVRVLDP